MKKLIVLALFTAAAAFAQAVTPTDPAQIPAPNAGVLPSDANGIWANLILSIERQTAIQNRQKLVNYQNAVLANQQANVAHALHGEQLQPDPAPAQYPLCTVHVDVLWAIYGGQASDWSRAVTCDAAPAVFVAPPLAQPSGTVDGLGAFVPMLGYPGFYVAAGDNPAIALFTVRQAGAARYMKVQVPGTMSFVTGGPITGWVQLSVN